MKGENTISNTKCAVSKMVPLLVVFVFLLLTSCRDKGREKVIESHDTLAHDHHEGMENMDMDSAMSMTTKDTLDIETLSLPVNDIVVSSQRSIKPVMSDALTSFMSQGYITIDERRNFKVSARFGGRIEKLFVKYNLQYLQKGEKFMELYSPDLKTYQDEFVQVLESRADSSLIEKAREKLRLLGITESQIKSLEKTRTVTATISVFSPHAGYVFFKGSEKAPMINAQNITPSGDMGNMSSSQTQLQMTATSNDNQFREGDYINQGEILFWINDLKVVWGIVVVDNQYASQVTTGENVSLLTEFDPADTIKTAINFIEPIYQDNQKFATARIYIPNAQGKYKINSLLIAKILTATKSSMRIPYSSVLFLGRRAIVWVLRETTSSGSRIYQAREVVVSSSDGDQVIVVSGLELNDEVALNAAYLLDRESLIQQ